MTRKLLLGSAVILCAAVLSHAQTPVQPILQPHQFFVDGSGSPCAGCSLYTYLAGTTTPTPTYTDSTGNPQNTNPIVLDVTGSAQIWTASAISYKFVLKDTGGTTLWTVDNVRGTIGCPTTGCTFTGPITAPQITAAIMNNICVASAQGLGDAGLDIQRCIDNLPAAPGNCNLSGGGIVDATGFTGPQTIAGLNFRGKPVTLNLGSATYDVTGIINATNSICGVTIIGDGARMLGDTGAGNPVIDLVGTSKDYLKGFRIATGGGSAGQLSTIGILAARSVANPFNWWHHFVGVQVQLQSNPAANGGHGTIGIYNYGAEVSHYENVTLSADNPLVGTRSNIWSIPSPDIAYYGGLTTMDAVAVDGKSDLYTTVNPALTLDGAAEWTVDLGEASGNNLIGVPAIWITGNTNDNRFSGEYENFTRMLTLSNGAMFDNEFGGTCANCQNVAFSGNVTYNSSTTATPASMVNLAAGQLVTSADVPFGTYITAVGGSTITLSQSATATSTVATTTGEPVFLIDSRPCGSPCDDVSNTRFHTGSYNGQYAYYLIGLGSQQGGSIGWEAFLSEGGSLYLSNNDGNPTTGTVVVPHGNGLTAPVIGGISAAVEITPGAVNIIGTAGILNGGTLNVATGNIATANVGNANLTTATVTTANVTTLGSTAPINLAQSTGAGQFFANVPATGWGIVRDTAGSGVAIGAGSTAGVLIDNAGNTTIPTFLKVPYTLSLIIYSAAGTPLPTCNSGLKGADAKVSDATAPTYMAAYVSGGAVVASVLCNGTTWVTH